jgi:2-(1,2-epoxy-1,2-dihydrophenyl)acetyl-CoA isomerase
VNRGDVVRLNYDNGIAEILLDRPMARNALRGEDWLDLRDVALDVARSDARAVVIKGADHNFCAGFDVSEISPSKTDAFAVINGQVNPALRALRDVPVPVIAAVEGDCVGGGFGIVAACDIVLCAQTARLGSPYSAIGIMCDAGLHTFLRDTLGYQRAAHLIFTGKLLRADEALALGLCADVYPDDTFGASVQAFAQRLASGPTMALAMSKRILRHAGNDMVGMEMEAIGQARVFASEDAEAGISAFLSKLRPSFKGR